MASFFKKSRGFTMIETLVALGVLGMFFAGVAQILQIILQNTGESRVRTTALALAQSKMELIKNLPFSDTGTVGGIPPGSVVPQETITINNLPFTVTVSIVYIDDPYDGIAPADLINTDYKRVRVEITWGGTFPSRKPVSLVTNIVPEGSESVSNGGTLSIAVFDSSGLPIPNATVKIDNTQINPPIHMQTLSNNDGLAVIPGAPNCNTCYEITVTKTGYSTDKTYGSSEITNPLQPHVSVIAGQVSRISHAIDRVSSLTIRSYGSQETGYPPISNVRFTLKGTKIIGYDANDDPVLKYTYTTNTGGGIVTMSNLEWDTYDLDLTDSFFNLAGSSPIVPVGLNPGTNMSMAITVLPKTNTSLLVTVNNNAGQLQASASANLSNATYNITKYTSATGSADFGQVYFSGTTAGIYDLKINLPGYQEASQSVNINTNQRETVTLNPVP